MAEGEPSPRLADFLIIGAMRSGTTSLYRYLGAHPEVYMAPKELQFFTVHHERGPDWYAAQFARATATQRLGEATADYLARESAMLRIAATLPRARLVATLRHPTERAWSHYGLLSERGRETRPFATALDEELAAIEAAGIDAPGVIYLSHGRYDLHLERCRRLFDPEALHVVIFEQMKADPTSVYRGVCQHLGVDPGFVPADLGRPVNAYVTFRSVRLRDASKSLPRPLGRIVGRLNARRNVTAPAMPSDVRRRLDAYYAPVIEDVERILGRALPEWQLPPGR